MFLYDYHMHSLRSGDGKDAITDMCGQALKMGLEEIAVTDHFEPCESDKTYPFYNFQKYIADLMVANVIYFDKIKIKSGVELGQPHMYPEVSLRLIEENPYDYVIASDHKLRDGRDFSEITYTNENVDKYCSIYLDELTMMAKWDNFDCLGHLDLVKRYAARNGISVHFMDYAERLEEILKTVISNGKGIEVNASGLRQKAAECFPGLDILRFYKQLGGQIITVGSDAHNAVDVGKGINEAIELIKAAGFDYLTVYTKRQPSMIKI